MSEHAAEKQHQASGKRIADLRREGQIMRSKDLTSGLVFIIAVLALIFMANQIKNQLEDNFITLFIAVGKVAQQKFISAGFIKKLALQNLLVILPIFGAVVAMALFSPYIFGGWNFTLYSIRFKPESFNPINNLKTIFSTKMLMNIIKSSIKFSLVMSVLGIYAFSKYTTINHLMELPITTALPIGFGILKDFIIIISASLVAIMLYDVIAVYFEFQNKIKMTSQELKDENKESEGNPEVKRRLRSVQLALMKQRLTLTVPKATVIITNPTHYAVAIRYEEKNDKAPKIVAKGKGSVAQQIRQLAISNRIPIYQAPVLARAVYNTSKVGAEVNPGLYMGVALVLSYVHQLKNYQHGLGQQPQYVADLKVPEEFIYKE